MKKIFVIAVSILFFIPQVFSQTKAGKTDTMQHATYNSCGGSRSLSSKEAMKMDISKGSNCSTIIKVNRHDPSQCPQCGEKRSLSAKEEMKAGVTKLYTCPMHPDVPLDKNGICSKCIKVEEKSA